MQSNNFFIPFVITVMLLAGKLSACCCKGDASCTQVKASVSSSVKSAIEELKGNDKNIYAAKLRELNDLLKRIKEIESNITKTEKRIDTLKKAESYFENKKLFYISKINELEKISGIVRMLKNKSQLTTAEIMLLNKFYSENKQEE